LKGLKHGVTPSFRLTHNASLNYFQYHKTFCLVSEIILNSRTPFVNLFSAS
jgi:hypothetical protein